MNDRKIYILVVDDEHSILKMLKLRLERSGYVVDIASNGKKAIAMIDENYYDVILTDIKMPEFSGEQILRHVKLINNDTLPVIGMSGTPWLLEQNDYDAILSKPCTTKELISAINQIFK
ncbi:MAG: response regulator [Desulfobacteraceae bacterium]|nr:response regulator [Desulfobacteraceae bacterium]